MKTFNDYLEAAIKQGWAKWEHDQAHSIVDNHESVLNNIIDLMKESKTVRNKKIAKDILSLITTDDELIKKVLNELKEMGKIK